MSEPTGIPDDRHTNAIVLVVCAIGLAVVGSVIYLVWPSLNASPVVDEFVRDVRAGRKPGLDDPDALKAIDSIGRSKKVTMWNHRSQKGTSCYDGSVEGANGKQDISFLVRAKRVVHVSVTRTCRCRKQQPCEL